MLRRIACPCLLLLLLTGLVRPGAGQVPDDSVRARALRDLHGPDGVGKDGPLHKAGLDLLMLYHRYRQADDRIAFAPEQSGLSVTNGRVVVEAIAAETAASLRADLERLGMQPAAEAGRVVSGRLPIEQIPAAARLASLRGLMPSRARTRTPSSPPRSPEGPQAPPAPASQRDTTDAPETPPPEGPLLFLLGSALTVLLLEAS
jgi:hypothetical protein